MRKHLEIMHTSTYQKFCLHRYINQNSAPSSHVLYLIPMLSGLLTISRFHHEVSKNCTHRDVVYSHEPSSIVVRQEAHVWALTSVRHLCGVSLLLNTLLPHSRIFIMSAGFTFCCTSQSSTSYILYINIMFMFMFINSLFWFGVK